MDSTYRTAAEQAAASAASAQGAHPSTPSNPVSMPVPGFSSDPELRRPVSAAGEPHPQVTPTAANPHPPAHSTTELPPPVHFTNEPHQRASSTSDLAQPHPSQPQPVRTHRISTVTNVPPSIEKLDMSETGSTNAQRDSSHRGLISGEYAHRDALPPLPPIPQMRSPEMMASPRRARTIDSHMVGDGGPYFNVPYVEKRPVKQTVGQRLEPTVKTAREERAKYELKAKWTGYSLNIAIGLQVLLGSLTTGLSAVAATGGKSTAVSTTILGGAATLVASYLARARGSNEPELSITRVKDLEHFIRDCEAFQMDYGHILTNEYDTRLIELRRRFEELLGNANGERKLAPPV